MTLAALILLLLLPAVSLPQQRGDKEIRKKEKELQSIRAEIQTYEERLRRSEAREKSTLEVLDDLENQSNLIRKLLKTLKEEESDITNDIHQTRQSVVSLELQLHQLRTSYAGYIQSLYKHGRVYDLELLFSSKSINQLLIRIEYLKKFSEQRARDLAEINKKKDALESENSRLESALASERQLISEKTRERRNLSEKLNRRKVVLRDIKKDKTKLAKALDRKKAAANQVEKLMTDLIQKEEERKAVEAAERERKLAAARAAKAAEKTASIESPEAVVVTPAAEFELLKGRLRWPVDNGSVSKEGRFGRHVHPDLKTVTQNTGIDIKARSGSNVYAVADGEVAALSFIPGFGNIVIINNYSGYHTVYAHLADISVAKSDRVRAGDVI
ncbi:MAG: peptidoglycan DD-metalloendopeptidase family protein, partial [Methanothrix sp.]|nr:peptidoglycan DD-metalloendopeptidase family protein [Methanothrix sp.]